MDVRKLVKPNVRKLVPYEARVVPCRAKLDANESPTGFKLNLGDVKSNRYPDPEAMRLRRALARGTGLGAQNVLVGNGSDELIYYLITTFGGPVMYPTPTFSMYGVIAHALGERTVEVPLLPQCDIDQKAFLAAMRKEKPRLIFLSSPNNPTGNCFSAGRMLKIIERSRGIVVVDEAYQAFAGGKGFIPFLQDYPNLLVMRTLSKVGLAALRVGYLMGPAATLSEVNRVRLPFNVNALSQETAVAALKDRKAMNGAIRAIVKERERLMQRMDEVDGVEVFSSEANFVMFRVKDPAGLYARLLKGGVLVRDVSAMKKGCLRVTVGARGENDMFLRALLKAI